MSSAAPTSARLCRPVSLRTRIENLPPELRLLIYRHYWCLDPSFEGFNMIALHSSRESRQVVEYINARTWDRTIFPLELPALLNPTIVGEQLAREACIEFLRGTCFFPETPIRLMQLRDHLERKVLHLGIRTASIAQKLHVTVPLVPGPNCSTWPEDRSREKLHHELGALLLEPASLRRVRMRIPDATSAEMAEGFLDEFQPYYAALVKHKVIVTIDAANCVDPSCKLRNLEDYYRKRGINEWRQKHSIKNLFIDGHHISDIFLLFKPRPRYWNDMFPLRSLHSMYPNPSLLGCSRFSVDCSWLTKPVIQARGQKSKEGESKPCILVRWNGVQVSLNEEAEKSLRMGHYVSNVAKLVNRPPEDLEPKRPASD